MLPQINQVIRKVRERALRKWMELGGAAHERIQRNAPHLADGTSGDGVMNAQHADKRGRRRAVCDICAEDESGCIERGQEEGAHHPRQRHAVHDHHQHDGITKSQSEADEGVGRPLVRCARVVGEVDAEHDDVVRGQEQRE